MSMATARKAFEGELVCYLIASLPMVIWGVKPLNPDAINPWKQSPKSKELEALDEWRRKRRREILNTPPSKR